VLSPSHTPLEELRLAWQSAAETFCASRGLSPSLLGVVVSELQEDDGSSDLPPGVHKFKQVGGWWLRRGLTRWLYRCIVRNTDRWTDRQTDRQIDMPTYIIALHLQRNM
jgi:hypothetical protein